MLAKLRGRGNERALRRRHRAWYAALAARQEAYGPRRAEWIAALDADHENLRAALEFCLSQPGEAAAGAELACDLWQYWETHGHLTEGRRVLAALLEQLDETAEIRPQVLWIAGYLAMVQTDLPSARTLLEDGLSAADRAHGVRAVAYASTYLGYILYSIGETDQGHALAETALGLHRQAADPTGIIMSLLRRIHAHVLRRTRSGGRPVRGMYATGRDQRQCLVSDARPVGARGRDMDAGRSRARGRAGVCGAARRSAKWMTGSGSRNAWTHWPGSPPHNRKRRGR